MLFIQLKDGSTQNLLHISEICVEDNCIVYKPAKGSLNGYKETYETVQAANSRFDELKSKLLVNAI